MWPLLVIGLVTLSSAVWLFRRRASEALDLAREMLQAVIEEE
jgi:hypothetical protein